MCAGAKELFIEFHRISKNHSTCMLVATINLPNRSLAMARPEARGRTAGANAAEDVKAARRTVLARENFMLGYSNALLGSTTAKNANKCWKKVMDGHRHLPPSSLCFVSS